MIEAKCMLPAGTGCSPSLAIAEVRSPNKFLYGSENCNIFYVPAYLCLSYAVLLKSVGNHTKQICLIKLQKVTCYSIVKWLCLPVSSKNNQFLLIFKAES